MCEIKENKKQEKHERAGVAPALFLVCYNLGNIKRPHNINAVFWLPREQPLVECALWRVRAIKEDRRCRKE